MGFLIRTGLATGVVVAVLALASAAWIEYSTRSSCASIGSSAVPRQSTHNEEGRALVDEILPVYQFGEKHSVFVEAAPERVFDALERTKGEEQTAIRLFDLLPVTAGKRDANSLSEDGKPLHEMLRETSGLVLEEPDWELVAANIATVDEHTPRTPQTLRGFVAYRLRHIEMKLPVSFRVDPEGGGSRLTTETRIAFADRNLCRGTGMVLGRDLPGKLPGPRRLPTGRRTPGGDGIVVGRSSNVFAKGVRRRYGMKHFMRVAAVLVAFGNWGVLMTGGDLSRLASYGRAELLSFFLVPTLSGLAAAEAALRYSAKALRGGFLDRYAATVATVWIGGMICGVVLASGGVLRDEALGLAGTIGFGAIAGLWGVVCGGLVGLVEGLILGLPVATILGLIRKDDS